MHDLYSGSSLLALLLALNGEAAALADVSDTLDAFIIADLVRLPRNLQTSRATFGSM